MKKLLVVAGLSVFALTTLSEQSHAWGRRGHAMVCETAATLISSENKNAFLRSQSFDLGYYCNAPDLAWKKPATYDIEWTNHFQDLEIFERGFKEAEQKGIDTKNAFKLDRLTFNSKFPEIKDNAGRAYWRVQELEADLAALVTKLKSADLDKTTRQTHQAKWLVTAGAIGHYIGDLAQPLHVTENYDGQMTGQPGVHAHFEDKIVDAIFHGETGIPGEIVPAVMKRATAIYKKERRRLASLSTLDLMQELAKSSNAELKQVLDLDKKTPRAPVAISARLNRSMAIERMATGSVYLAEIWRRHTEFTFDSDKFYNFENDPAYIAPPKAATNAKPQ